MSTGKLRGNVCNGFWSYSSGVSPGTCDDSQVLVNMTGLYSDGRAGGAVSAAT